MSPPSFGFTQAVNCNPSCLMPILANKLNNPSSSKFLTNNLPNQNWNFSHNFFIYFINWEIKYLLPSWLKMAYFTQIYYKNFAGLNNFVIVGPFLREKGECFVITSLISSHFCILLYFRAKSHSNVTSLQRDYEAWEKYLKIGWFRSSISIDSAHKANLSTLFNCDWQPQIMVETN